MKNLVRSPLGIPLLCCWDDCGQYGDDREKVNVREGKKRISYIFCSGGHKAYWLHSHISYGNRPGGFRKPGIIIPGRV